jgi:peptide/nickel transport system ATP-binding protein
MTLPSGSLTSSHSAHSCSCLRAERGIGYLFITHDLSIVRQITDYLYVMHRGQVVESGPTDQVLSNPSDAYTIKLLNSVPRAETDWLASHRALSPDRAAM